MKSLKIVSILFLFFVFNVQATIINNEMYSESLFINVQKDSLFPNNRVKLNEEYAKFILYSHHEAIVDKADFSKEDLFNIAISYAYLKKPTEASEYLKKYIQNFHDISIINEKAFHNISESKEYIDILKKYRPELNGWIIFYFSTGIIGIFIAIVLNLRKDGDRIANMLISLFVLFHSFFMIHICLFLSKFSYNFPHSLYITTSFSFLYGPMLYFYFRRISSRYKFRLIDALHLVPSILLFLYLLPIYLLPADQKLHLLYNTDEILHSTLITVVLVKYVSLIVYGYLIFGVYKKCSKNKSKHHVEILKWKGNMTILNTIYVISYIVYGIALMSIVTTKILIYPQVLSMSIIVLYVGYVAYVQPRVFSKKYLFNEFAFFKYKKSGLTESYSSELKEQLLKLFNEKKIYKMNDINLDILSQKLGVSRHSVSQVINEHFNVNFFSIINKFRIQEAQEIFKRDTNGNLNIIDVAYDVGFNNKVTFNKAFKEETKLTPTQFITNLNDAYRLKTLSVNFK